MKSINWVNFYSQDLELSRFFSLHLQQSCYGVGGDDAVPVVSVAVRRPASSAVGLTGHAHTHIRDLRSGPEVGGSGSRADGGTPGESGCGGAAEGQLTVLSHPGLQVRPHTLRLCQCILNPVSGYTQTAWKSQ